MELKMIKAVNLRKHRPLLFVLAGVCVLVILFMGYKLVERQMYPMKYKTIVENYAAQYQLDKHLVYAVIKAESRFNEKALSHKGAVGLMQITMPTANWISGELGREALDNYALMQPENNILYGCFYLRYLMDIYNGNISLALCAYNAGSGNVAKWLQDKEYSPDGINLVKIPFKETKNYLEKTFRYYGNYVKIYQ